MGFIENEDESGSKIEKKKFTEDTLTKRELIIDMLKYEDSLIKGKTGEEIYKNPSYKTTQTFDAENAIIRLVLDKFHFETNDDDIKNYNKIFKTYHRSPTDYDSEVVNSVAYMRENRCVYYTSPEIKIGDTIEDCKIYDIDGTETSIKESLGEFEYAFIAGFSNS
jgi:hypothetical protein